MFLGLPVGGAGVVFLQIHLQRYNPEIPQDEDRFGTTGRTQLYTVLSKDNYLDEVQARRAKYDKLPTEDGKDLPKSISFGIAWQVDFLIMRFGLGRWMPRTDKGSYKESREGYTF